MGKNLRIEAPGKLFILFLSFANFCSISSFSEKNLSGIPSECQTFWVHIELDLVPNRSQFLSADDTRRLKRSLSM